MRAILADWSRDSAVTPTELEDRFAAFVDAYQLPRPDINATVTAGGRLFEVDCAWRDARVIVELDGRAVHATRKAFERDRERDRILVAAGWRVVRVTWRQLHDDAATLAADLRQLLDRPAGGG